MRTAVVISELNKGVVFEEYLDKESFEELEEKMKEILTENKLEWLITFLQRKGYYIRNIFFDTKNSDISNVVFV